MTFYVYNNWTRDRGRIHRAECSYCNNGKGIQTADSGKNGEWRGPYENRDLAFEAARSFGRADMEFCKMCAP